MLRLLAATHRIRRSTRQIHRVASACAIVFGMCLLSLAHATVFCPGGSCGGIGAGVTTAAGGIAGVSSASAATTIGNIIATFRLYLNILALAVIVIAGFYLILGLGSENSKETAKKILLYTAIGVVIVNVAETIRDFFFSLDDGTASTAVTTIIQDIIDTFTSYVGILSVAVIIIAGFYLILGLGSENSKETARKIILYTAIGIIVIALANVIVDFLFSLDPNSGVSSSIYGRLLDVLLQVLSFVGLLAVAVIVIAGIMLVLSLGDEGRKDTAKKTIIYALIGLVVIILASSFVRFIAGIF